MTVLELKEALEDVDDNCEVIVYTVQGCFVSIQSAQYECNLQRQFIIETE